MQSISDLATSALSRFDELARHSNVYRAVRFWAAQDAANLHTTASQAAIKLSALERFADLSFEENRPFVIRYRQMEAIGPVFAHSVADLTGFVQNGHRRNLALHHQLYRARKLFVGDRRPEEAIAYINRCHRQLDVEPSKFLVQTNNYILFFDTQPKFQLRHQNVLRSAQGVLAAHNGLRTLLMDPYFQRVLYSEPVGKGGKLTHLQIAADVLVGGALAALIAIAIGSPLAPVGKGVLIAAATLHGLRLFLSLSRQYFLLRRPPNDDGPTPPSAISPAALPTPHCGSQAQTSAQAVPA